MFNMVRLFLLLSVLLAGCGDKSLADLPKEGDIVVWKQKQLALIIKAKLGPRRTHIPDPSERIERRFYKPHLEHYVGQFPIDYVPEKFPPISERQARELPSPHVSNQLQFNLMLNGSTVQATDLGGWNSEGLDHPDQVKVFVNNAHPASGSGSGIAFFTTKEGITHRLGPKGDLDSNSKITQHGMDCYSFKESDNQLCFGESDHPMVSGFQTYVSAHPSMVYFDGWSSEYIYGGLRVRWHFHRQHFHRAKEIDAAVWRLLDTWNVAPLKQHKIRSN